MQITLNQQEIEKAIISYVGNQGIAITGKHVSVSLSARRGEDRMSATIDISNDEPNAPADPVVRQVKPASLGASASAPETTEESKFPFANPATETEASGIDTDAAPAEPEEKPLFGG